MGRKSSSKKHFFRVTLAAVAVSSLLYFTSLDNKFFDLFLRLLPSLTENEKVFVLTLDDDSINYAGGFPFKREVMGDVVVLLKELGVQTIVFDLSYLDESPPRLDPAYAAQVFDRYLSSGFAQIDDAVAILGHTANSGQRELYLQDIRNLNNSVRSELENSISLLIRDVDEYFAQSLAFSGCSWLTLTMLRPQDLLGESDYTANPETDHYLAEYITLENVIDAGDGKTPQMAGVMPAIQKLLSRAKGAGFVNAGRDSDGLYRRIHLLAKYKDNYYGHLTLTSLREMLGYNAIEVSNKAVTLIKNDKTKLRIPRAQDGTMLLKWPKKKFYDYRMMSLVELVQHTVNEPDFAYNIGVMHDSWFFMYWDGGREAAFTASPWEYYLEAETLKNTAFANNETAGGEWLQARENFFNSCRAFLSGPYEERILADVGDDIDTAEFVRDTFDVCRSQYNRLAAIRRNTAALADSFCVIGADATSMTDNGLITFQENFPLVGTYATAANMLLSGEFIKDTPFFVPLIIALLYALLIAFLASRFDTHLSIIIGVSGLLLLSVSFAVFFRISKIYLGFAVPLSATALTFIAMMVIKFLTASREKAFLHGAFSRYLAPEVISEIINDPDKLNLGGEKREMTAIFTDIQGFSTISEKLDPAHLVRLLNRYLTAMSNIIMHNKGTIDKYEGDAIIAFFGAPVMQADHPALACRSALAMKAAERELNKTVVAEGLSPVPIFTRIGINTGEMVVGNMGAENKMDYTIMGNAVNLAARLEGVNKQYKTGGILISEYTRAKLGDEFLLRRLDRVRVVGINTPLRLYELLAVNNEQGTVSSEQRAAEQWERAIDFYEARQFKEAVRIFSTMMTQNPDDKTAGLYASRCMEYGANPPPDNWDAVNNLTEK
ncbi:MAG: CHASE2 domain-containing protein [Treponema sp.]|jgi:adenylate cyclase|nr:CHASE2 domain-containing protein [Treponema sp.]